MDLPFTNIRQVLSLHNKVSPEKIFLTVISDQGREELSYAEFSARCHQTANFLQEDLGIKPGDVVAIGNMEWSDDTHPADTAVLFMACWLIGAVATYFSKLQDKFINDVSVYLVHYGDFIDFNYMMKNPKWDGKQIVQLGGKPSDYPYFHTLVRGMPNTFFNAYPEPTLDMPAFCSIIYDSLEFQTFSQGDLLGAAQKVANAQFITGNQRLISYMTLGTDSQNHLVALNTISLLIAELLVGGSLIVDLRLRNSSDNLSVPKLFWHEIAASRLHIACLGIRDIALIVGYGQRQRMEGNPIYGTGIYQQDITQLRHIYCPDAFGSEAKRIIQQFTAMFPFPVITNS